MNAEEAKFIMESTQDNGSSVVRAAVKKAHPMWKVFFDEGWTKFIHKRPGERRKFLEMLVEAKDTEVACDAFRLLFQGRPATQVATAMNAEQGNMNIFSHWVNRGLTSPNKKQHVTTLLGLAISMGGDINAEFSISIKRGGSRKVTALSCNVLDGHWGVVEQEQSFEEGKLMLEHGAKVTELVKQALLEVDKRGVIDGWMRLFSEYAGVTPADILSAREMRYVDSETVTYLSALAAKMAIDSMDQGKAEQLKPLASFVNRN